MGIRREMVMRRQVDWLAVVGMVAFAAIVITYFVVTLTVHR